MESDSPKIEQTLVPEKKENFWKEIVKFIFISAVIILPIRFFIAQPFIVSGASMDPTFKNSEYLIIDEISYRFKEPSRGDVVIFKFPLDKKKYYIKRIVGLPGEEIEISQNDIKIKNKDNPSGFILEENYAVKTVYSPQNITLEADEYFVMGDNRPVSSDSRYWGAMKRDLIIGRPILRLLPPKNISIFPGSINAQNTK